MPKYSKSEKAEAIAQLRDWIKPGDTVYTIVESVSRSGMSRAIRVVFPYLRKDNGVIDHLHPNHSVAVVLDLSRAKRGDGVIIGGCGMDMGFQLVYLLSHALYPSYTCLGKGKCPSNYHVNYRATVPSIQDDDRHKVVYIPNPEGPERFDLTHSDGYCLRQRWL